MSNCSEHTLLLNGLIDGELDAANSVMIETHIKTCAGCAAAIRRLEAIRAQLADPRMCYAAPPSLLNGILTRLEAEPVPKLGHRSTHRVPIRWFAGGALSALAASFALFMAVPQLSTSGFQEQLVASHMRSLLATHLTDVATSNQHVVKPWFNGRIDFAIPVVDLAEQGFPLLGGRLDYLGDGIVPALVYKHRLHTVNLFIRPASGAVPPVDFSASRRGFSILGWNDNDLEYWAVSDVSPSDLKAFEKAFKASTRQNNQLQPQ